MPSFMTEGYVWHILGRVFFCPNLPPPSLSNPKLAHLNRVNFCTAFTTNTMTRFNSPIIDFDYNFVHNFTKTFFKVPYLELVSLSSLSKLVFTGSLSGIEVGIPTISAHFL